MDSLPPHSPSSSSLSGPPSGGEGEGGQRDVSIVMSIKRSPSLVSLEERGPRRGPGRPRLPTPERRRNILASKAKWKLANREYYLEQKRELANRVEYLARRRELRAIKRMRRFTLFDHSGVNEKATIEGGDRTEKCILDYSLVVQTPGDAF